MISGYRRLWLLVEGADDSRFCTEVLTRLFRSRYDHIEIWEYSQQKPSKLSGLLQTISYMNDDYLLIRDMDDRPCVTATKEAIASRISGLSWDRVVVVPREIEAWYLAGLDEAACGELGLDRVADVDSVTKEQFDQLVGGKRQHQPTMDEILKRYNIEVARRRSPSFRYFWQKHVQQTSIPLGRPRPVTVVKSPQARRSP